MAKIKLTHKQCADEYRRLWRMLEDGKDRYEELWQRAIKAAEAEEAREQEGPVN